MFYDGGQVATLWGKNLYDSPRSTVARRGIAWCSSAGVPAKLWTRHELKAAQARAFKDAEEYLLPARFDDTEIPGLLPTVAYIDLTRHTPEAFADLIAEKVRAVGARAVGALRRSAAPGGRACRRLRLRRGVPFGPQPLVLSDAIAKSVRRSLKESATPIDPRTLLPYLHSDRPAHRVTGYMAYQIAPFPGMSLAADLAATGAGPCGKATRDQAALAVARLLRSPSGRRSERR